jgi:hypothetical protein
VNNTGLVFGRVTDASSGAGVKDAVVDFSFLLGDDQRLVRTGGTDDLAVYVKKVHSNEDGRYVVPFYWEAADIGKLGMGFGTVSLAVTWWGADANHFSALVQRPRVMLTLDMRKLIGVGYSSVPASSPELVNVLKDFYASYREMLSAHQVFYPNTPLLSTEVYGLLGQANFSLAAP